MTPSGAEAKLPRRDWILLPLLSLLTMVLLAVPTELIARRVFSESKTSLNNCLVLNDAATGVRAIPNSVCWEKIPENQLVEYRFDCAGYRTGIECGPKPPGTFRIVMVGSSVAMGERVPLESTLTTLLPKELSRLGGHNVELYNEAIGYGFPRNTVLRFNDVLAAKPDLILWVITPADVKLAGFLFADNLLKSPERASSPRTNSIGDKLRAHLGNPLGGTVTALRHLFYEYESQQQYIQSSLIIREGDEGFWDAGVAAVRAEPSQEWEARLKEFRGYAADIEGMASGAGVPLVATLVPNRAQAAMVSLGEWPAGFDPYRLNRDLHAIITSYGGTYVDILPDFRTISNPERSYYPLDGHLDASGHAIIAEFLAKELRDSAVPQLRAALQPLDIGK